MRWTASLPMYNLPEMRAVNARLWEALRGLLLEAGLHDVPEQLSFERPPVPDRIGPEVLFSQTCGYPLETILAGQAVQLGTPCYAAPGCDESEIDPSTAMMFGPPAAAEVASV
jgi:hypothetical protein